MPLVSFGVGRLPGISTSYTMEQLFYITMMYPLNTPELINGYQINNETFQWFSKMNIQQALDKKILNSQSTRQIVAGNDTIGAVNKFLYFSWNALLQYYNGVLIGSYNYDVSQYFYRDIPVASVAYLYGIDNIESSSMKFNDFLHNYLARAEHITDSEFRLSDIPLVSSNAGIFHQASASVIMNNIRQKIWDEDLFKVTEKMIINKNISLFDAYHKLKPQTIPRGQYYTVLQKMIGEMTGALEMPSLDVLFRVSLGDLMNSKRFPIRNYGSMRLIDLMVYLIKGTSHIIVLFIYGFFLNIHIRRYYYLFCLHMHSCEDLEIQHSMKESMLY